ncbi:MAG: V-type ATPase subunit [Oscillospiraceae bacterium]|nr:V-type ATPase subunit [Oscillospiraceae bacterium]
MGKIKKLDPKDFIVLSAYFRALTAKLPDDTAFERAISASSFSEAAKTLADCGLPDMSGLDDLGVNAALSDYRRKIFAELDANEKTRVIADIFRMEYDCHNIKVLVKSHGESADVDDMLSASGNIDTEVLKEAFYSGERQSLPKPVRTAMDEAEEIITKSQNPQLADMAVDRIYFEELLNAAESTGTVKIISFVRLLIDKTNLRTFVRMVRIGRTWESILPALLKGGSAAPESDRPVFDKEKELASLFTGTPLRAAAEEGQSVTPGTTVTAFELKADDAMRESLDGMMFVTFGPEVLFYCLKAIDVVVSSARMVLTGKLYGVDPDILRERIRKSYV